jgi:hypothetical protein
MQENSTGVKYYFKAPFLRLFIIRLIFPFLQSCLIYEPFRDSPFFSVFEEISETRLKTGLQIEALFTPPFLDTIHISG